MASDVPASGTGVTVTASVAASDESTALAWSASVPSALPVGIASESVLTEVLAFSSFSPAAIAIPVPASMENTRAITARIAAAKCHTVSRCRGEVRGVLIQFMNPP